MQDLSSLLPGDPVEALTGRSSMAATNTVSDKPEFSGPGTPSESTSGESPGNPGPSAISYSQRVAVDRGHSRPAPIRMGEWNDIA